MSRILDPLPKTRKGLIALVSVITVAGLIITSCNNGTDETEPVPEDIATYSIFGAEDAPDSAEMNQNDGQPLVVGMKFQVYVDGSVTGIRFYKSPNDSGDHVGSLWTLDGQRLAMADFQEKPEAGWQDVLFGEPVQVKPGEVYVASYLSKNGTYSGTAAYFTAARSRYPIVAVANDSLQLNGTYDYSPADTSIFPRSAYSATNAANYWVDVLFKPAAPLKDSTAGEQQ